MFKHYNLFKTRARTHTHNTLYALTF